MAALTLTFSGLSPDPASVVQLIGQSEETSTADSPENTDLGADSVRVQFLAAPINPQDLMVIAGRYPVKPVYSESSTGQQIPGNDGVARVEAAGPAAKHLSPGDLVIPKRHGLGTWRTHAVLPASDLLRLPRGVDPVAASLLKMSFCPAYLLLEDTRPLKPGDWIVMNAAAGAIAQMVAQLARLRGCHTIGIVRDPGKHPHLTALHDVVVSTAALQEHGAHVHDQVAAAVGAGRVVLALDAVFGPTAAHMAALLAKGGTLVNYGSLGGAHEVLPVTQELLFWKEITFRNFRLSSALGARSGAEQESLLAWFAQLLLRGVLVPPVVESVNLTRGDEARGDAVRAALLASGPQRALGTRKQVLIFAR